MGKNSRQRGFPVRAETLRTLRTTQTLSQEAAAHRAGVSEKLIRKAESGGRLDGKSLAALSTVYSTIDAPLCAQDLLAGDGPPAAPPHSSPLKQWLIAIWSEGRLEVVDRLAAENIRFHWIADFDEALRLDSTSGSALFGRSVAHMLNRSTQAIAGFQATIDLQGWKGQHAVYGVILGNLAARQAEDESRARPAGRT